MDSNSMTMEQQQRQILDIYYQDRHTSNCVYPSFFQRSRAQTRGGVGAEHLVYVILCKLNEPMFTMHSKRFCVLQAGEMDFLIFSKDRGIIILEVKSGRITRDYNQGLIQLEKAATAVKMKVKKIKVCGGHSVSVRYAVVMPNVSRTDAAHEEGCYKEDISSIEAFNSWYNYFMPVLEDRQKLNNVNYDKCLSCFLSIILTDYDLNSVHSHLMSLTPEQAEILEGLGDEAYITGPAGSGKTACMVIKARSEELKDQSKLVVVFNEPLRDHLGKNSFLGVQNIHVMTFNRLLQDIIGNRMRQTVINNENYRVNKVNTAIQIALDPSYVRYDSIFIDEAQDLYGDWELLFNVLHNKADGHYKWIFYDNNQKVSRYSASITQSDGCQKYHLTKVIRNTKKIFEASMAFYQSNKTVKIGHTVIGPEVQQMFFDDQDIEDLHPSVVQSILWSIGMLSSCFGTVRPGDICVLMENEVRAKTIGDKIEQKSDGKVVYFRLNRTVEYMEGRCQWPQHLMGDRGNIGVTVDSVSRFKGLESKAVILVIGARNPHNVIEKMYVGTTRAFCHLTVICA